jgi:hypothetical protein
MKPLKNTEMKTARSLRAISLNVVVLGIFALAAGLAVPAVAEEARLQGAGVGHVITLGAGYALPPFGSEDAYSGAIGAAARYELQKLFPFPLCFAASLAFSGFVPQETDFGSSIMIQGGVLVSYRVFDLPIGVLSLQVIPYLGYKHYFRWHLYAGEQTATNRPVAAGGMDLRLQGVRWLGGLRSEYDAIVDNEVRHSLAFELYAGLRF